MTTGVDPTALIGTVLDRRYRIDSVVGPGDRGGWVFHAREVVSGEPVAVRCPGVPDTLGGLEYEEALDTFLGEAKALARASGSSGDVEQLLAYGIAEPAALARLPYCVFEWLEGKSLEQLIEERGGAVLSISEALAILEPAARGLASAHAAGVAHRDVRPGKLWLASVGGRTRMKVTQFVLASRIGRSDDAFAPEYGAPEHFKRSYGVVGAATDVYGLALSLVELVSGRRALEGHDRLELYLAASDLTKRPTLRARGVQVSDAVEAVLARALAVDPKRRWQNARELWDALVAAVPELTPAAPSVRPRPEIGGESSAGPSESRKSSVPSIWAARDPASAVTAPAEDARLTESAKVATFAPRAPDTPRGNRTSIAAWVVVGLGALLAIGLVVWKLRQTSAPASKPTPVPASGAGASPAMHSRRTAGASAAASASSAMQTTTRARGALPDARRSFLQLRRAVEQPEREPEERQRRDEDDEGERRALAQLRLGEKETAEVDRDRHEEDDGPEDPCGQSIAEHGRTLLHVETNGGRLVRGEHARPKTAALWPMIATCNG